MSSQLPIRPDAMPLREALRGLRFLLRRGGETLADTLTMESLPKPAAAIAGAVLREVEGLARNVDGMASGLAKSVLGGHGGLSATLHDMTLTRDADAHLAAAVYVALSTVLARLGAPGVFVSEAAARTVFARHLAQGVPTDAAVTAAGLTLDLLDARVMRGTTAHEAARVRGSALEPVAVFAVLLWLQSTRSEDENEDALRAAADLAVALADDVALACATRDAGQIASLYAKYAAHV